MEVILCFLVILAIYVFAGIRGLIAQNRLQKFIDTVVIRLVGFNQIDFVSRLTDIQKDKILVELRIFTISQRTYPLVFSLYRPNRLLKK